MIYEIESIRIDGQNYAIKWLDYPDITPSCAGEVCYQKQTISIYKTQESQDIQTLLHEIVHIVNENRLGSKLNEAEIETLSNGITQVLLDNQDMTMQMAMQGVEFEEDDGQTDTEL